ncbi:MAG: regulatory protein LuxR [Bradyrhizobium sp.]|nr:regulatory protein LuxR [Bradyrhizobium sp.]
MMLGAWSAAAYELLIDSVGTSGLGEAIRSAARSAGHVEEVFGFFIEADGRPIPLVSAGALGSSRARASLYSRSLHSFDPLLPLIRSAPERASIASASLAIGDIEHSDYRRECFERPGLRNKISFFRTYGGGRYVLNFYTGYPPARADALGDIAELTLPLLRKHGALLGDECELSFLARLDRRLAAAYPLLTKREREVCAFTMSGMTAEATSLSLGISEASVLTYRRRAYARYAVSSAGQFIERLLH